jgi:acyl-CoA reductase-like NAD-dependent aldehyde dehydrogenase
MSDTVEEIRALARSVGGAGAELRSAGVDRRVAWLATAASILRESTGHRADALAKTTGLSAPMVSWAARTTLDTIRPDTMKALVREAGTLDEPPDMLSVILAGNVFTASVRGIAVPLLFGVPVLVKASSRETLFPSMLRDALHEADSSLGTSIEVVVFEGGDRESEATLIELAEAVAVYGSDETLDAIRERLVETAVIAHGHGVSMAYCSGRAFGRARIDDTISRLALDVCAYDQRGCLSPQVIFVEQGEDPQVHEVAKHLAHEGLAPLGRKLPRGPLPPSVGAAQAQWRGVAEVEGTLLVGDDHAIAVADAGRTRWSPGYRNVTLVPVSGLDEALVAMDPLGASLKCVGVDPESIQSMRARLNESDALAAYACPIGEMQTPPLDAPADGRPVWEGLKRR